MPNAEWRSVRDARQVWCIVTHARTLQASGALSACFGRPAWAHSEAAATAAVEEEGAILLADANLKPLPQCRP